jgi:hypothetical protein
MHARKQLGRALASIVITAAVFPANASALELDLHGSLGDAGFTHYVSPVSSPLFNETPYITTEARPMWIHQNVPNSFVSGGDIDAIAVQLRVAITDRIGFIATKDGWADVDFNHTVTSDAGAANIAFGFKYAALALPDSNSLITVGAKYEAPTGGLKTRVRPLPSGRIRMQGQGDGLFDLFVSGARTFGPVGVEANLGTQLAVDTDADTSFLHWSLHLDYDVIGRVFPLVELNGYTPIIDGNRTALGVNGMDLVNLGSSNSSTIVTIAPGLRVRILDNVDFGGTFEVPITSDEDLMDWRITTDFVIHM